MLSPVEIAKKAAKEAFDLAMPPAGSLKLAARLTDSHICPMVDGVKPHGGGPIIVPCSKDVIIGYQNAARVTDPCTCVGPPDAMATGTQTVLINYLQAARLMDTTVHGGVITSGCFSVVIGDSGSGGAGGMGGMAMPAIDDGMNSQIEAQMKALAEAAKDGIPFVEDCTKL